MTDNNPSSIIYNELLYCRLLAFSWAAHKYDGLKNVRSHGFYISYFDLDLALFTADALQYNISRDISHATTPLTTQGNMTVDIADKLLAYVGISPEILETVHKPYSGEFYRLYPNKDFIFDPLLFRDLRLVGEMSDFTEEIKEKISRIDNEDQDCKLNLDYSYCRAFVSFNDFSKKIREYSGNPLIKDPINIVPSIARRSVEKLYPKIAKALALRALDELLFSCDSSNHISWIYRRILALRACVVLYRLSTDLYLSLPKNGIPDDLLHRILLRELAFSIYSTLLREEYLPDILPDNSEFDLRDWFNQGGVIDIGVLHERIAQPIIFTDEDIGSVKISRWKRFKTTLLKEYTHYMLLMALRKNRAFDNSCRNKRSILHK